MNDYIVILTVGIIIFFLAFAMVTIVSNLTIGSKKKDIAYIVSLVIIVISVATIIWSAAKVSDVDSMLTSSTARIVTTEAT